MYMLKTKYYCLFSDCITIPTLCSSQTEESIDNFDFDMARLYCQRALEIEPTNLTLLDMMGNICAELGDIEKAKEISFTHTVPPPVVFDIELEYVYPVLSS